MKQETKSWIAVALMVFTLIGVCAFGPLHPIAALITLIAMFALAAWVMFHCLT